MTSNITLITTLVLTAAVTSAGTYYLTTNGQPSANPIAEAAHQPSELQQTPEAIAVNQQHNKPVEITIKTEVVENHRQTGQHNFIAEGIAARNRPQPHYEVLK
jgi:flagellar basal body-associated protein FliL